MKFKLSGGELDMNSQDGGTFLLPTIVSQELLKSMLS